MQESFALPHAAGSLLLALRAAHIRVSFVTASRLAAAEISTSKILITGNRKDLGLPFPGERVAGDAEFNQGWDWDGKWLF